MSLWDNSGDERGCDEGHWDADTRGIPLGFPEVVGTVKQVHRCRRRLLRMGLEFYVCTINKSAHTKKNLETYRMPLVLFFPSSSFNNIYMLYFDLRPGPKILFQGNTPEGSDTFQRPVIERDRVGGLRLMIWDRVKVPLCHYSHAPEESNLWTAWQLFPLDDD